jgi:hypothetical protein
LNKLFGIGLTRTGTSSLAAALDILGIKTIHYPNNPGTYAQLLAGDFHFDFLKRYDAATDISVARYFSDLDRLFPDSRFILTTRNLPAWLRSCDKHFSRHQTKIASRAFDTVINMSTYGCIQFREHRFKFVYEQHVREVKTYFTYRPNDLLEMDITAGQGWELLCSFLHLPIPDAPFPHRRKQSCTEYQRYKPINNVASTIEYDK